jgi:nucleoside-diphosphate-sugar epimerase
MVKVLITGGAGYVGSVVTGAFLDTGHQVTVLDSLVDGGQGLLGYAGSPDFQFQRGDVRDERAIRAAMAGQDVIVHLAAVVGFGACNADPRRAESINVEGTRTLLAARDPEQFFLYASTGSVYGAVREGLCHEGLDPQPLSVYGRTKLQAERLVVEAANCTAYRFATAFGMSPRMRVDLLVNGFVYDARLRGYVVIYDGAARRTFIHVRDMARAFLFAIEHAGEMDGQVYNCGAESLNHTKDEIVELLRERLRFEVFHGPVGADEDQRDYAVSYAKIEALGYRASVTMAEGLDELVRGVGLLHHRGLWNG